MYRLGVLREKRTFLPIYNKSNENFRDLKRETYACKVSNDFIFLPAVECRCENYPGKRATADITFFGAMGERLDTSAIWRINCLWKPDFGS